MLLARVDGTAVVAVGHPSLAGWRLLICQPLGKDGQPVGTPVLAIDDHGAGLHSQVVLTSDGRSLREVVKDEHSPIRYRVIAISDKEATCA